MGREIRRVPPNWKAPENPHFNQTYDEAAQDWVRQFNLWCAGKYPAQPADVKYFWEWAGSPPEEQYYRPAFTEEATWYQLYENVSEGTPISPPFPTQKELAQYLTDHGDYWHQKAERENDIHSCHYGKPIYEQALRLIKNEGALSFIVEHTAEKTTIKGPYEQ